MDIEHFIQRENEERQRAAEAASESARAAHAELADLYRDRITDAGAARHPADDRAVQPSAA
ncbi:MAG: hypothetical protein KF780_06060 [Sphingomonas sp.]|nr:hypothetical protein [Sphingomonas sp.]